MLAGRNSLRDEHFDVDSPYPVKQRHQPKAVAKSYPGASPRKGLSTTTGKAADRFPFGQSKAQPPKRLDPFAGRSAAGRSPAPVHASPTSISRTASPRQPVSPRSSPRTPVRSPGISSSQSQALPLQAREDKLAAERFLTATATTMEPLRNELVLLRGQVKQLHCQFDVLKEHQVELTESQSRVLQQPVSVPGYGNNSHNIDYVYPNKDEGSGNIINLLWASCLGCGQDDKALEDHHGPARPQQQERPPMMDIPMPKPLIRRKQQEPPAPPVDELEHATSATPSIGSTTPRWHSTPQTSRHSSQSAPMHPVLSPASPMSDAPLASSWDNRDLRVAASDAGSAQTPFLSAASSLRLEPEQEFSPERTVLPGAFGKSPESGKLHSVAISQSTRSQKSATSAASGWRSHPHTGGQYELPFPEVDTDSEDHHEELSQSSSWQPSPSPADAHACGQENTSHFPFNVAQTWPNEAHDYLPFQIRGAHVLLRKRDGYLVDNSQLKSQLSGLTCRNSKNPEDKGERIIDFGSMVDGVVEQSEDGMKWLKVSAEAIHQGHVLPNFGDRH